MCTFGESMVKWKGELFFYALFFLSSDTEGIEGFGMCTLWESMWEWMGTLCIERSWSECELWYIYKPDANKTSVALILGSNVVVYV